MKFSIRTVKNIKNMINKKIYVIHRLYSMLKETKGDGSLW